MFVLLALASHSKRDLNLSDSVKTKCLIYMPFCFEIVFFAVVVKTIQRSFSNRQTCQVPSPVVNLDIAVEGNLRKASTLAWCRNIVGILLTPLWTCLQFVCEILCQQDLTAIL